MELYEETACLMNTLGIHMTLRRKQFLRRFQVLLILRGFETLDRRSVQSAMEVLINLRRHPIKQHRCPYSLRSLLAPYTSTPRYLLNYFFISYLKAVIKSLDDCIGQLLAMDIDDVIEGVLFFFFSVTLITHT